MAATLYPTALAALLAETLDWTAEEIHVVLLGPSFVFDPTLVYASELPSAHIIIISELGLANRSYDDGVARGDPAAFLQLLSNQEITHAVVFQHVGDLQYSPLIAYYDADNILGAPLPPLGLDVFLYSPVEPGGWFQVIDSDLIGLINTELLGSGDLAIAELSGGLSLVMPTLQLGNRLNVNTHVVCAGPDEPDDCCEPEIRSSRCD
jgi:hypothetical protein